MTDIGLVIIPESFARSDYGTISGEVYLRFADLFFPERGWSDIVVPVTSAWLVALQNLVQGQSRAERVSFMDGPFRAEITTLGQGAVGVHLVESRLRGNLILHQLEAELFPLLAGVIGAATQVLDECRHRNWLDRDVSELARQRKRATRVLNGRHAVPALSAGPL